VKKRGALAAALVAAAAACTFSRAVTISPHLLLRLPDGGRVNSFNLEEQLALGYIPEVIEFFGSSGAKSVDSARGARILGQALLEAGDFRAAEVRLERAYAQESRGTTRAETAWLLSQAHYWQNDFENAASWARRSVEAGQGVPQGWITFLASAGNEPLYAGVPPGTHTSATVGYGHPDLPRLAAKVNDKTADLILDSGASLSLLTESAAKRLGVVPVPDATAGAYGLHRVELTMHFGWAPTLSVAGVTLTHVPFGILPDEALTFETATFSGFKFDGVLGIHLLKEFDWVLRYNRQEVRGVRLDPSKPRGGRGQNVFFRRLKPMVRVSFNQEGWFLFLLDTGSEPTMVTRPALRRSRTRELEGSYPMTIEGIGKSRVSWAKMSDVTVGLDRYMVKFKDLVVKEENEGIEDGVLGSSFLGNFEAELRFSTMTLKLERTVERLLREAETGERRGGS
jgi:hypothetical protein